MIDTRAIAQEVQDQLTAAAQKGHEQFRKGQEQIRKSRESVTGAVRAGGHLAQAVKPNLPKLPSVQVTLPSLSELTSPEKLRTSAHELATQLLAAQRKLTDQAVASQRRLAGHAQELTDQAVARQRKFAGHAQELAEQAIARQRKLGDRAIEVAGPFITDGVTRLTHAAGTFVTGLRSERGEHAEPLARPLTDATAGPAPVAEEAPEEKPASTTEAAPAKPKAAKPATAKPAAAKTAASRTRTAKTSAAKDGTGKTAAAKTGSARTRNGTAGQDGTAQK